MEQISSEGSESDEDVRPGQKVGQGQWKNKIN